MDCKVARERMHDWIDGRLDGGQRGEVMSHLRGCTGCERAGRELLAVVKALSGVETEAVPPGVLEGVVARLQDRSGQRPGGGSPPSSTAARSESVSRRRRVATRRREVPAATGRFRLRVTPLALTATCAASLLLLAFLWIGSDGPTSSVPAGEPRLTGPTTVAPGTDGQEADFNPDPAPLPEPLMAYPGEKEVNEDIFRTTGGRPYAGGLSNEASTVPSADLTPDRPGTR